MASARTGGMTVCPYGRRVRSQLCVDSCSSRGNFSRKSCKSCGNSNPVDCSALPPDGTRGFPAANRSRPFCCVGAKQAGAVGLAAEQQMSQKRLLTKVSLPLLTAIAAIAVCSLSVAAAPSVRPSVCGTVPYPTSYKTPSPITQSPQVWSFVSEPKLHPMKVMVNTYQPGTSSGFIFVAPYTYSDNPLYGQPGSLILDNIGNPFWVAR
jgi:hypothetical protein